jgi:hypothetical protein
MEIRIRQTGAVMYESELRSFLKANDGPSYDQLTPEVMEALGVDPVLEGPQATTTPPYQYSQRSGVELLDGKWYTKYIAGPVFTDRPATDTEPAQTAAEQEAAYKAQKDTEQAKSVRNSRDDKLKETDWRVIKALESNLPQDFAWATYRQNLRDVTAQAGFPWEIIWPTVPE